MPFLFLPSIIEFTLQAIGHPMITKSNLIIGLHHRRPDTATTAIKLSSHCFQSRRKWGLHH